MLFKKIKHKNIQELSTSIKVTKTNDVISLKISNDNDNFEEEIAWQSSQEGTNITFISEGYSNISFRRMFVEKIELGVEKGILEFSDGVEYSSVSLISEEIEGIKIEGDGSYEVNKAVVNPGVYKLDLDITRKDGSIEKDQLT